MERRTYTRRQVLGRGIVLASGITLAPTLLSACSKDDGGGGGNSGGSSVRVGAMTDETGDWASYGAPTIVGMNLAVKQLNAAGGVLGKQLDVKFIDGKTDIPTWVSGARELATDDAIVAILTGGASNEREAIRDTMWKNGKLYFYNHQYEGGVCDKNVFSTGIVPEQQVKPLVEYLQAKTGPKMLTLSADYNYGHIATAWTRKFVEENGGQVLKEEYFPLDVTDFGATITEIQQLKPDYIISHLVGTNHLSFHRSMAATGLASEIPVGAPVFGLANDQLVLGPEDSVGIHSALNYYEDIDTPAAQQFNADVRAMEPNIDYISNEVATSWTGWKLWAAAVEKAGSFDIGPVTEALESGMTIDSPEGTLRMDGPTHQISHNISIATVGTDGGFVIVKTVNDLGPIADCDLIAQPDQHVQKEPGV